MKASGSVDGFLFGFCAGVVFIMSESWPNTVCTDRLRGRVSGAYRAGMRAGFAVVFARGRR